MLAAALCLDLAFAEPPAPLHPVVWIGRLAGALACRVPGLPADPPSEPAIAPAPGCPDPSDVAPLPEPTTWPPAAELAYGAFLTLTVVAASAALAAAVERSLKSTPSAVRLLLLALALKPTFALRALLDAAEAVREPLAHGDLATGRQRLRSLVSRDPSELTPELIAAAAVESLAENASDSLVAPWLFYLVGGLPAAYAYRAANTLDAMLGYRGRYEWLGKSAAKLDDALNYLPARLTALLIAAASGAPDRALAIARRDHAVTASPNAGWPMAAMAGALGVRLEKVGHYRLGDALRPVEPEDIRRAAAILTLRRLVS